MSVELALKLSRHGLLFLLLVVCAYFDLARNRVPNWCTIPAMIAGVVLAYWLDALAEGSPHLFDACVGLVVGAGVFLIPFLLGGMGGGDVKLMGAVGALGGFTLTVWAIFYAALVGAAMAIGVLIWHGRLWMGLKRGFQALWPRRAGAEDDVLKELSIPYGFAVAAGVMWAWFLQML